MTEPDKVRLPLADFAMLFVAASVGIFAAAATAVSLEIDDYLIYNAVFWPLYPGLYLANIILPRSGDDYVTAIIVAAIANFVAYAVVVFIIHLLWRYITLKHALQPGNQTPKETP